MYSMRSCRRRSRYSIHPRLTWVASWVNMIGWAKFNSRDVIVGEMPGQEEP